jgi:dTDP-4-amino-4,6-dideoxygalactose transaminase
MTPTRLDVHPFLSPAVYLRRPARRLPFPLDRPGCRLYARGRHGLWHALRELGLRPGDEVLAPAYHHGSEIEALRRAGLGLRFYEATETLEPDVAELEALLAPRVRALHLTHYLGFPQDAARWRAWCDARGLLLVEDAAQSWLSSLGAVPVGSHGDIAFFSLYKTVGLADGAALVSAARAASDNGRRGIGALELGRLHRAWLARRLPAVQRLRLRPVREYDPGEDFDLGDPGEPCARTTPVLLRRAAPADALHRRRSNYRVLLEALGDRVPPPFGELHDGACPLYFPVRAADKDRVLARLADRGVRGLDLWRVPHAALAVDEFPGAAWRRSSTIGLAVHQGMTRRELALALEAAREALGD